MLTPEESALLLDMNQRLRELHVQKAKAQRSQSQARAAELQTEIDALSEDCDKVLDASEVA
jgi:flagellin-like hook-associated protein FlgL